MQLCYPPAAIGMNFPESLLKKFFRDQTYLTGLFVVYLSPSFEEFTAPLCHILPIHNVTINSNILFVNVRWTFTLCVEEPYEETHLTICGTSDQRCHFKYVSIKASYTIAKQAHLTSKGSSSTVQCFQDNGIF
jgi:hypothetical protein